jgi:hypothetical protein
MGMSRRRDSLLNTNETRDWRPLIFLAVLGSHFVMVIGVMRAGPVIYALNSSYDPLVLLILHQNPAQPMEVAPRPHVTRPRPATPGATASTHAAKAEPVPENGISAPSEVHTPPTIDWEHESELAAQNSVAAAEEEKLYRDLSGLLPAQRSWIAQNHMESVPPGIQWNHPRVEWTSEGLPIFWVNDHCIIVPLVAFMMFCKIGHIEANGDLFKHMHDRRDP